jgi:hypothetical protein
LSGASPLLILRPLTGDVIVFDRPEPADEFARAKLPPAEALRGEVAITTSAVGSRGSPLPTSPAIRSRASAGTFSVVFERRRAPPPGGVSTRSSAVADRRVKIKR